MDITAQVGIVSIYGRGHWLAAALAQAQVPVTLLDVSAQMGQWLPEDYEGPFGFFQAQGLQEERLRADEKVSSVEQGLTLWLSSGPVELGGPTAKYRLAQLGVPDSIVQYISSSAVEKAADPFKTLPFREAWLGHFSHALTSSVDTLAPEANREGMKRNLFSPFFVRHPSSQGLEKSLKWCESKGVTVLRHVEVKDLGFQEKQILGSLEIRRDKPGLFNAEQYVLCLTAEECGMLSHKVQHALFDNRVVEPEWAWVRYRVQFKGDSPLADLTRNRIPMHCVVIEDLMLPWTHENLLVLKRSEGKDQFDAWMKIPNNQRFHSQYLQERGQKMKMILESRLPDNRLEIVDLPREAGATFQQLGPTRFPVFSRALRAVRRDDQMGNVAFDSPEFWKALCWEGQFEHQQKIFQRLKVWWDRKEELRIKREAKEAAKRNRGANP